MAYQIDIENALVYLLELDKENKGVSANDLDELASKVAKCLQTRIYIDKDLISLKHVAENNPVQFSYFNHRVYRGPCFTGWKFKDDNSGLQFFIMRAMHIL